MERIFALERRSWKASGTETETFPRTPGATIETFHREVARAFAATDGAVVLTMDVGERPVAGIYCLERDGVVMPINTFMDEAFADRLTTAPMFRRLIEMSIERGLKELDFNGYTDNIAKWADKTRASSRFYFYNRRPYSRFLRDTVSHGAPCARGARVHPARRRARQERVGERSMPGLSAIVHLDGTPVDPAVLAKCNAAAAHRGRPVATHARKVRRRLPT